MTTEKEHKEKCLITKLSGGSRKKNTIDYDNNISVRLEDLIAYRAFLYSLAPDRPFRTPEISCLDYRWLLLNNDYNYRREVPITDPCVPTQLNEEYRIDRYYQSIPDRYINTKNAAGEMTEHQKQINQIATFDVREQFGDPAYVGSFEASINLDLRTRHLRKRGCNLLEEYREFFLVYTEPYAICRALGINRFTLLRSNCSFPCGYNDLVDCPSDDNPIRDNVCVSGVYDYGDNTPIELPYRVPIIWSNFDNLENLSPSSSSHLRDECSITEKIINNISGKSSLASTPILVSMLLDTMYDPDSVKLGIYEKSGTDQNPNCYLSSQIQCFPERSKTMWVLYSECPSLIGAHHELFSDRRNVPNLMQNDRCHLNATPKKKMSNIAYDLLGFIGACYRHVSEHSIHLPFLAYPSCGFIEESVPGSGCQLGEVRSHRKDVFCPSAAAKARYTLNIGPGVSGQAIRETAGLEFKIVAVWKGYKDVVSIHFCFNRSNLRTVRRFLELIHPYPLIREFCRHQLIPASLLLNEDVLLIHEIVYWIGSKRIIDETINIDLLTADNHNDQNNCSSDVCSGGVNEYNRASQITRVTNSATGVEIYIPKDNPTVESTALRREQKLCSPSTAILYRNEMRTVVSSDPGVERRLLLDARLRCRVFHIFADPMIVRVLSRCQLIFFDRYIGTVNELMNSPLIESRLKIVNVTLDDNGYLNRQTLIPTKMYDTLNGRIKSVLNDRDSIDLVLRFNALASVYNVEIENISSLIKNSPNCTTGKTLPRNLTFLLFNSVEITFTRVIG